MLKDPPATHNRRIISLYFDGSILVKVEVSELAPEGDGVHFVMPNAPYNNLTHSLIFAPRQGRDISTCFRIH